MARRFFLLPGPLAQLELSQIPHCAVNYPKRGEKKLKYKKTYYIVAVSSLKSPIKASKKKKKKGRREEKKDEKDFYLTFWLVKSKRFICQQCKAGRCLKPWASNPGLERKHAESYKMCKIPHTFGLF